MRFSARGWAWSGLIWASTVWAWSWCSGPASGSEGAVERPRLLVVVVFDQMRGDYLERWKGYLGEGGIRRLLDGGAVFLDCQYPYAITETGVGHASLLTGASPDRHGIVANGWWDRASKRSAYCATEPGVFTVGSSGPASGGSESGSPWRLLSEGVGDTLKAATGGAGKVVGLSFKDRAAVLTPGLRADLALWYDGRTGEVVTSTRYAERLPDWVLAFNAGKPADAYFGREWTESRPEVADALGIEDDGPGEADVDGLGTTFPRRVTGGLEAPGPKFYSALGRTPFGNDLLLALTRRALEEESLGLGRDEVPDILTVSFSSNDLCGHTYGPDSREVFDITMRSDGIVRGLMEALDATVGEGRWTMALTSDHGVGATPERAREVHGVPAGRLKPSEFEGRLKGILAERHGAGAEKLLERVEDVWIHLSEEECAARGLARRAVAREVADLVAGMPEFQTAFTDESLERAADVYDEAHARVRKSRHPGRTGDVFAVLKPYHQLSGYAAGTDHGTPHAYDAHVPLIFYGKGIGAGVWHRRVEPQLIAPVFAALAGVPEPRDNESSIPAGLLSSGD